MILAPDQARPEVRPHDLSYGRDRDHEERDRGKLRIQQSAHIDLQPRDGEEDRGEDPQGQALQLRMNVVGEPSHVAEQNSDHERSQHGLQAQRLSHRAAHEHHPYHEGQQPVAALDLVLHVVDRPLERPPSESEADAEEEHHVQDGGDGGAGAHGTRPRQAGHDTEQDPAHGVVVHSGGQDRLPHVPTHQVEIDQDLRDDGDGRDRHRGRHEQGEDEPPVRLADQGFG